MFTEDQLLPLSALQHWLYCPRQCGLIHLEQVWAENQFTAEGQVLHHKAHEGPDESKAGVRITRSMPVRSFLLGISGQCDIVEFQRNGDVVPVEYKRGKPKSHRADDVQLCAQVMCLEEMLAVTVPSGFLFYGENRRRFPVEFDDPLRQLVTETAAALHAMIESRVTPLAEYDPCRCDACSLIDICQPKALRFKRGAQAWFSAALKSDIL
ncbi:MAG: CRISPR-associated protein Cas4 [Verrucomicrobia bacterium]|nr:MAG: CRISPR-associated protein Cas4 [Verrucomicrobiota bacterium]